jgi:tetratricopeptide (TPR) repeat protein
MNRRFLLAVTGLMLLASACSPLIQANTDFHNGQYAQSIPYYREYLQSSPRNVEARIKLGYALLRNNNFAQASTELAKALQLDPASGFATLYLGQALLLGGRYDAAAQVWSSYADADMPMVQATVKRQLTLVRILAGRQLAQQAMEQEDSLSAADIQPGAVAVSAFKPFTNDEYLVPLKKALQAMIIAELAKIHGVEALDRFRILGLLEVLQQGPEGVITPEAAARVGLLLKAGAVVVGGLSPGLQATPTIISAPGGEILTTLNLKFPQKQFVRLVRKTALQIAAGAGVPVTDQEKTLLAGDDMDFASIMEFGEGLDAVDHMQWSLARERFTNALDRTPSFTLCREWLLSTPDQDTPSGSVAPETIATVVDAAVRAQVKANSKPSLYDAAMMQ